MAWAVKMVEVAGTMNSQGDPDVIDKGICKLIERPQ
jgi:hypothetical protein